MPGNCHALFGQILLGGGVVLSLMVVGHLARLKIAELRKHRRMAEQGGRFGLIQDIIGTGIPLAKESLSKPKLEFRVTANASSMDRSAKRWTTPSPTGGLNFQWN
jgi:hypothetical protein